MFTDDDTSALTPVELVCAGCHQREKFEILRRNWETEEDDLQCWHCGQETRVLFNQVHSGKVV